jgi:environmental stress-induced protein Ves
VRRLGSSDYKIMPWKNGGGITTEIAVYPQGSGLADFDWRVSIADMTSEGPFSSFPGCERTIMMLEGSGMILDAGSNGIIELREAFQPRRFSGDWHVMGRLLGGPVRDFNLIVRRGRTAGELNVLSLVESLELAAPEAGILIAHVMRGNVADAAQGETLVADDRLTLTSASSEPALIALVRIRALSHTHNAGARQK